MSRTVSLGYTVAQTARLVAALRWAAGHLSSVVAVWAREAAADGPETAVWMTTLSRRLAWHRESLEAVQPDSVSMQPYFDAVAPDPSVRDAVDEIATLQGTPARLAVARQVLVPHLADALHEVCAHAAPHCDAALAWAAEAMGRDLRRCLEAGAEPGRVVDAGSDAAAASGAAARAERALGAAGGIVPRPLLRPDY